MSEENKDAERARVVDAMCMTWRHDFGLERKEDELGSCGMTDGERDALRRQMGQLYDHHLAAPSLPAAGSADLTAVRCQCCATEYPHDSYDAGFIAGSGMCQVCDAAIPAVDLPSAAPAEQPYPHGIAEDLERSDWAPLEALQWYAAGNHFDVADGRTRIIDTGAVASNALKHASLAYLELKGDAELSELRSALSAQQSAQHPDDDAVDRFAEAMKAKLARSREKGRHGWQTASAAHLSSLLYHHMYKADPLDVANLAMMLHQNGQAIELPQAARKSAQDVSVPRELAARLQRFCQRPHSSRDEADALDMELRALLNGGEA